MSFVSTGVRSSGGGGNSNFRDQRRSSGLSSSLIRVEERPIGQRDLYRQYDTSDDDDDDDDNENEEERMLSERHGEAMDDSSSKGRKNNNNNNLELTTANRTNNDSSTKRKISTTNQKDIDDQYRTITQKKRIKRPTLTVEELTGVDGLIRIPSEFTKRLRPMVPKSRTDISGAATFSRTLMNCYDRFAQNLFPILTDVCTEEVFYKIEYSLGPSKSCRDYIQHMRHQQRDLYLERVLGSERAKKIITELDDEIQLQQQLLLEKISQKHRQEEEGKNVDTTANNDDVDSDKENDDNDNGRSDVVESKDSSTSDKESLQLDDEPNDDDMSTASRTVQILPKDYDSSSQQESSSSINPSVNNNNSDHNKNTTTTTDSTSDDEGEYEATFGDDATVNETTTTLSRTTSLVAVANDTNKLSSLTNADELDEDSVVNNIDSKNITIEKKDIKDDKESNNEIDEVMEKDIKDDKESNNEIDEVMEKDVNDEKENNNEIHEVQQTNEVTIENTENEEEEEDDFSRTISSTNVKSSTTVTHRRRVIDDDSDDE